MNKFLAISFGRMYQLYLKWGDEDAFYHTAFVQGVLLASAVNFIIALLFNLTGSQFLKFRLFPVGVFLISIIGLVIFYFYSNKDYLIESNEKLTNQFTKYDWFVILIILLMFSTWIAAPIFYKMGVEL